MKADYVRIAPVILIGVKSVDDVRVLLAMTVRAREDGMKRWIYLTAADRKEILEELKISNPRLTRALRRLLDLGILTGSDGRYEIDNPNLLRPA